VTQNYPHPSALHGGGQDLWRLIDHLRKRHTVCVATYDDPAQPTPRGALAPCVADLKVIRYARTPFEKLLAVATALARGYRDLRLPRREWEMRRTVRRWCDRYAVDVIHCGWTEMGRFLGASPRPMLRVLDEVEVRFVAEEDAASRGALDAVAVARRKTEELAWCRAADLVLTRAEADLALLRAHIPDLRGFVLPPAGNVARFIHIQPSESVPGHVLFVGAMNRGPNVEAVCWLATAIWPSVRRAVPEARLYLVGAFPPPEVRALAALPGVTVTGAVPDLRPYYARARVIVAPMRAAGGQLNKIIDGLATGRPVVATAAANRGTGAPCVRVEDTAEGFAAAVIGLLRDVGAWEQAAAASRDYALAHFDWPAAAARLESLYEEYALT
jgi:glycosyltransferase involved in cell wall biosynthesis